MSLWNWLTRKRTDHGWPGYIINGRIRTSTACLLLAFVAMLWLYNAYQPTPPAAEEPAPQVVPPGFVPDPAYTWVPRTYVQTQPKTTTTTPTTTTELSPTETTNPTETSSPVSGLPGLPGQTATTIVDPDGPGPLPPQTTVGTATSAIPAPPTVTATVTASPSPVPVAPPR